MYNPKLGVLCSALTSAEAAKGSFSGYMAAQKGSSERMTIRAARTVGKDRRSVQINGGRKVTRREAREHCFKMLFCQDFYPAEEKEEQLERYFEAPKEDVTGEDGKDEIIHDPFEKEEDRAYLEKRVEKIMELIPEIDEKINEIAEGWRTRRMGKVELTILRLAVF